VAQGARLSTLQSLEPEDVKRNKSFFRFLNDKDRDILYLVFIAKKKQGSVCKLLRRVQPLLAYDVRKIKERVRFIAYLHEVFDIFSDFVENQMDDYPDGTSDILVLMFYTTSLTLTAKILGVNQCRIRTAFEAALERMIELEQWDAYEIFSVICRNKNKIKRVYKRRSKRTRIPAHNFFISTILYREPPFRRAP